MKSFKEPADQDQIPILGEEKREKSKGKRKSGKPTEEQIECDDHESLQSGSIEDEKQKSKKKQREHTDRDE